MAIHATMTKQFFRILFLFSLITSACNESVQKQKAEQVPSIVVNNELDWGGNFKLHILKSEIKDSLHVYTILSMDNNAPIGFKLEVPINTDKFGEGIRFESLGDTSDNFLRTLSSIYKIKLKNNSKFVESISCNYAGLNDITYRGDGQKRDSSINYLKLFFIGTGEDYAELYLNIDESAKTIELEEKDSEYRTYIVKSLTMLNDHK